MLNRTAYGPLELLIVDNGSVEPKTLALFETLKRDARVRGGPSPEGKLAMDGRSVSINGLPLIFQHLQKKGLRPGDGCAERLLETVRVYHPIEPHEEPAYRDALTAAYQTFCERGSNGQRADARTNGRNEP